MREFTVRKGAYKGKHNVFDNKEEAIKFGIKNIKELWHSPDIQIGDWVVSDDGFVVQCLHRYQLRNKHHTQGQYTDTFRFPQGTFWVYYNRNGKPTIKNFYALVANSSHKNALGNTPKIGRYMNLRKKMFVSLIGSGVDPFYAYIKAFNPISSTTATIKLQVNRLLNDQAVREALMTELQPFFDKVQLEVKQATGFESLKDFIASKINEVATDTDATNKDKIAVIKLLLDLFGTQLGLTPKKGKEIKDIQEAEFESLPPPDQLKQ